MDACLVVFPMKNKVSLELIASGRSLCFVFWILLESSNISSLKFISAWVPCSEKSSCIIGGIYDMQFWKVGISLHMSLQRKRIKQMHGGINTIIIDDITQLPLNKPIKTRLFIYTTCFIQFLLGSYYHIVPYRISIGAHQFLCMKHSKYRTYRE